MLIRLLASATLSALPVIIIYLSVLGLVLGSSLLLILFIALLICLISAILLPTFPAKMKLRYSIYLLHSEEGECHMG